MKKKKLKRLSEETRVDKRMDLILRLNLQSNSILTIVSL